MLEHLQLQMLKLCTCLSMWLNAQASAIADTQALYLFVHVAEWKKS
jgi:hypothetical protein